ncbi:hypothetical protein EII14_03575 [Alloprevotella sp. OH1205_COT-284]|uniref:hypothetical protein n=1 Tax=Alloprevotella sp. OH1205_COT-284 TaxID=2491043 RepID=UPI000F60058D|nr:hypothetical protein [Alloprevotella sp. OH1205_COT-284]RRD80121.1 hypothetical protein EII14_03575 [Alloprevotella sp. OH1205_COT-284]
MTKYESQIYTVNTPQELAFARLSNLRHFETIKTAFSDPAMIERIVAGVPSDQMSPEKLQTLREQIEKMEFTDDTLTLDSTMGRIALVIIERDAPKLVKFETQGAPVSANLWVQLLPKGADQSALKVTVGAELNFFIRKMVEKHLKQAPDGIATFLSQLLAAG